MKNSRYYESGFDTAVLTQKSEAKLIKGKASNFPETAKNERLFLISNSAVHGSSNYVTASKENESRKRTHNRKQIIFDDNFLFNGIEYHINTAKSGIYKEILEAMLCQMNVCIQKWRRVFVLRFDLHQPYFTGDNKNITKFRKRFFQKLKREYGFDQIGFCWVREQEKSKAQHYHWVMFLDGDKIRHSSKINSLIKQFWNLPTGGYHVPTIKRPFYFVNNKLSVKEAIYRISYLAKTRGKGYRPSQTKDYQCSRMRP